MNTCKECTNCGDPLDDDEIASPYHDDDGSVMCETCYEDKFEDWCSLCDELVEKTQLTAEPGHLVVVFDEAPVRCGDDLKAGYYRVLRWPFFADGMIEGHFIDGALQHVADLDEQGNRAAKNAMDMSGPMCESCRTRVEATLTPKALEQGGAS